VLLARHAGKTYAMLEEGATICEVDAKVLDDLEAELLETRVFSLQPAQAIRLTITGAAPFTFEKVGDDWRLENEPTFRTDKTKITDLLNAMRDLRAQRYVCYTGADRNEYGLNLPAVTVQVDTDKDEKLLLTIASRGPADGGRYASTAAHADRVFVISKEDAEKFDRQVRDFHSGG
jgi:hypothetical protein